MELKPSSNVVLNYNLCGSLIFWEIIQDEIRVGRQFFYNARDSIDRGEFDISSGVRSLRVVLCHTRVRGMQIYITIV